MAFPVVRKTKIRNTLNEKLEEEIFENNYLLNRRTTVRTNLKLDYLVLGYTIYRIQSKYMYIRMLC